MLMQSVLAIRDQAVLVTQVPVVGSTLVQVVVHILGLAVGLIQVQVAGSIPAQVAVHIPAREVVPIRDQAVLAIPVRVARLTTNGIAHLRIANRRVNVAPNKRFERDAANRRAPQAKRWAPRGTIL